MFYYNRWRCNLIYLHGNIASIVEQFISTVSVIKEVSRESP